MQQSKPCVIIGLGNPGAKYEMTRHNMGAILVEGFSRMHGCVLKENRRYFSRVAKLQLEGQTVHLVLPTTYMNESGRAVRKYIDYNSLSQEGVIAVCDDADLPFGEFRLRAQGSSGGHNGLKSIEKYLRTAKYTRLRVGIGRQEGDNALSDFVLDRFSKGEVEKLPLLIEKGAKVFNQLMNTSLENVMSVVNEKKKRKKPNTLQGDKQEKNDE